MIEKTGPYPEDRVEFDPTKASPAPALEKLTEALNTEPTKENILAEAAKIIYGDREKNYGRPDRNLNKIADMWTAYVHGRIEKLGKDTEFRFNADDVCLMMALMKIARLINSPSHRDSQVDICGYLALMERCQNLPSHE